MLETLVNVNEGVNQLKTGISKSISTKNAQATNSINSRGLLLKQVSCSKFITPPSIRCTSWLVRDHYSTFLLLGVSSPWLLFAVSVTRHFPLLAITQCFQYSTYPVKGITCIFTQTFHYPTFQLLDVSALP